MRRESNAGFTILELLIATMVTLLSAGALLSLVIGGQRLAMIQPEAADQQQRARVAIETLAGDLARAGAGLDRGPRAGSLARSFAPMTPSADGGITIWYVAATGGQAPLARALSPTDTDVVLDAGGGCPPGHEACAFSTGTTALIFESGGCHDVGRVERVADGGIVLRAATRGCHYSAGAWIAEGEVRTYRADAATRQLLRRDEATGISLPVLDSIRAMTIDVTPDGRGVRLTLSVAATLLRVPDLVATIEIAPLNLREGW